MSLRSAQKRMTRNLLLESALRVFLDKGYAAATIDDLVSGIGANRATFYLHFSSKAELVKALIEQINDEVVTSDTPSLTQVVASGDKSEIRTWINRRFDQWPRIMPYVTVANQAAEVEPELHGVVGRWHETAISEISDGLEIAGRYAAETRRARAVAAFAQIEYTSRRWAREGWNDDIPRAVALDVLTDSLAGLLL